MLSREEITNRSVGPLCFCGSLLILSSDSQKENQEQEYSCVHISQEIPPPIPKINMKLLDDVNIFLRNNRKPNCLTLKLDLGLKGTLVTSLNQILMLLYS